MSPCKCELTQYIQTALGKFQKSSFGKHMITFGLCLRFVFVLIVSGSFFFFLHPPLPRPDLDFQIHGFLKNREYLEVTSKIICELFPGLGCTDTSSHLEIPELNMNSVLF